MKLTDLFFEEVKKQLKTESLAEELAEILSISIDSSYRRIRGDTALTFDELIKICSHFEISVDQFLHKESKSSSIVNFKHSKFNQYDLSEFLSFLQVRFKEVEQLENGSIINTAKDIPSFYFFMSDELSVFKAFFYLKVLWEADFMTNRTFDFEKMDAVINTIGEAIHSKGEEIIESYIKIPSIEIWNENSMDGHFNHILYSWESGFFEDKENALLIVDKTAELLDHIKEQARREEKYLPKKFDSSYQSSFEMYYSEGLQLENTLLVNSEKIKKTYLIYNSGDYLLSTDKTFYDRNFNYILNIKKRSSKISDVGEKYRNMLFSKIMKKLEAIRMVIENG